MYFLKLSKCLESHFYGRNLYLFYNMEPMLWKLHSIQRPELNIFFNPFALFLFPQVNLICIVDLKSQIMQWYKKMAW